MDDIATGLDCDVAIIGGGILGLATAARTAQRGYCVHVYRLSDRGRPRADTLRNQGWLQSGLIYVGKLGRDRRRGRLLASQMYVAGLTMLEGLELPVPDGVDGGILRVRQDTDEAHHLLEDARQLGIEHLVHELEPTAVRRRLGSVFETGRYFAIPDARSPRPWSWNDYAAWRERRAWCSSSADRPSASTGTIEVRRASSSNAVIAAFLLRNGHGRGGR